MLKWAKQMIEEAPDVCRRKSAKGEREAVVANLKLWECNVPSWFFGRWFTTKKSWLKPHGLIVYNWLVDAKLTPTIRLIWDSYANLSIERIEIVARW